MTGTLLEPPIALLSDAANFDMEPCVVSLDRLYLDGTGLSWEANDVNLVSVLESCYVAQKPVFYANKEEPLRLYKV